VELLAHGVDLLVAFALAALLLQQHGGGIDVGKTPAGDGVDLVARDKTGGGSHGSVLVWMSQTMASSAPPPMTI
jgi:hypothetical protein